MWKSVYQMHIEQVDENGVGQCFRPLGEDAELGLSKVGIQHSHATNKYRHF